MAVWQFDLDFEHADNGRYLCAVTTELLVVQLAQVMGASHLMFEVWRFFCDKYGNRVDVNADDDGTSQVQARVDARASTTDDFIVHVCAAAKEARCNLVSDELHSKLEPDPATVRSALQRFIAWHYALDPALLIRIETKGILIGGEEEVWDRKRVTKYRQTLWAWPVPPRQLEEKPLKAGSPEVRRLLEALDAMA